MIHLIPPTVTRGFAGFTRRSARMSRRSRPFSVVLENAIARTRIGGPARSRSLTNLSVQIPGIICIDVIPNEAASSNSFRNAPTN